MSKSLLEKVESLDELVRGMRKMESMLRSGQVIYAHRECCRIIAALEKNKKEVIKEEGK